LSVLSAEAIKEPRVTTKTLLSVRETAQLLGVHENTVRNWTNRGLLRAARLPSGVRRFQRAEVERIRAEIFAPAVETPIVKTSRRPRGPVRTSE
jgi:excisionase family DNA binding protein